ncbi:MAG: FtsQ-type POTRA domain-containing protein [Candidatus Hydrogenedentes bacterium]|nr:FtsQ-type POTRA domain-containing protein [Candidatus Hydrogenedentota bacterium]
MKTRRPRPGLAHRRRSKRMIGRRILKLVEIIFCVGVVGAFTYKFLEYAEGSTDFQVRNVEIYGLRYLNGHDVWKASGITATENILFFDSADVQARIEAMPYVRTCRVERNFPDTVKLIIREREPWATLMVNSRSYEIDDDGVVLRLYAPTEMPISPFFTEVGGLDFVEEGEVLEQPGLRSAMSLWRSFNASALGEELTVSELAVYDTDDIRMYCDELPYELRWGRGNFDRQVHRLDVLWEELDGVLGCSQYLDLRFDSDLVCM